MFLTQLTRCHCADYHWSRVTARHPGSRVQSGSTSSRRRYSYGCGTASSCGCHPASGRIPVTILFCRIICSSKPERPKNMSSAAHSPVGLHRVLQSRRGAAPGRRATGQLTRCRGRRGTHRGRSTQPRRGQLPPARHRTTPATATRSGPRCWRSSRAAARCRTRSPARAACSSVRSRRSGPPRRWGSSPGDRVATLVSLTLTPLRHHRRPGPLGWPRRAGAGRGPRDPVRPVHRGRAAGRSRPGSGAGRARRVRRAGPHRSGGASATPAGRVCA